LFECSEMPQQFSGQGKVEFDRVVRDLRTCWISRSVTTVPWPTWARRLLASTRLLGPSRGGR
jgi:hypothetical protein